MEKQKTAEPVYRLVNKSNKFGWSTECTSALAELKKKLLEASVLGYPNDRDSNTLTTDASLTGIGAILTQKQGTEDRVTAYASKTLSKFNETTQQLSGNYSQSLISPVILKDI